MANNAFQHEAMVSEGTVLTTELNSLAAGSRTGVGTEFDNTPGTGNNATFGIFELLVDFASAPAANGYFAIYKVEALDGTTYPDGSSSVDPGPQSWVVNIPVRPDAAAQRVNSLPFELLGVKQKYQAVNRTNQACPASGTVVELFTWRDEVE